MHKPGQIMIGFWCTIDEVALIDSVCKQMNLSRSKFCKTATFARIKEVMPLEQAGPSEMKE